MGREEEAVITDLFTRHLKNGSGKRVHAHVQTGKTTAYLQRQTGVDLKGRNLTVIDHSMFVVLPAPPQLQISGKLGTSQE